jgi:hypothetical protein
MYGVNACQNVELPGSRGPPGFPEAGSYHSQFDDIRTHYMIRIRLSILSERLVIYYKLLACTGFRRRATSQ